VSSASPKPALRSQRSRINQPDPAIPRSPGIILKLHNFNLTLNRVAGLCALLSLRSWIAPCSGAWLSPLRTDCSALCFVHPALTADLTRRSSLYAPPRLRIAPLPSPCAVPLTDCSVLDTSEPRAAFGLLRLRHLMRHAALRFLFARRVASRTLRRLLRSGFLTLPCRSTARAVRKHFTPPQLAWISPCLPLLLRATTDCSVSDT